MSYEYTSVVTQSAPASGGSGGKFAHRNGDQRNCLASTTVIGQSFVKVEGALWAVVDDTDTHGNGQLIASQTYVKISGKLVILKGDLAKPDDAGHTGIGDAAKGFSSLVKVN